MADGMAPAGPVSDYVTELCRSRLDDLDPEFAATVYNLTACEQQREDLEFLTRAFYVTDLARAAIGCISCAALLGVLLLYPVCRPALASMAGTRAAPGHDAGQVAAVGRARRRLVRLANRGGHNRWLGICLVTAGACWFFFLLFPPALDLPRGISPSDLHTLNARATDETMRMSVARNWIITLLFSMAAGFLIWASMGVNYTFPSRPGASGVLDWAAVTSSTAALGLLNVFYLNEMALCAAIAPFLSRPIHWWILCAALVALVVAADALFVQVLLLRRGIFLREQQQQQGSAGGGLLKEASESGPQSSGKSAPEFSALIPDSLWALIGLQPPPASSTSQGPPAASKNAACWPAAQSWLGEEPHFRYPVEILSISSSCAILSCVTFASAVEFVAHYTACVLDPEACRPETLELSLYGFTIPVASATLSWLEPPIRIIQAANRTVTKLTQTCQDLNVTAMTGDLSPLGEPLQEAANATASSRNSSAILDFLCSTLANQLQAQIDQETEEAEARETGFSEFARGLRYSAFVGYAVGLIVAIGVVINALRSFKQLVKAVRLDLLKRQLLVVTRGIRSDGYGELTGGVVPESVVEMVQEKGYIPFAVYCFGYMLSSSLMLLGLLGTTLTLLFALMAWPPFWAWLAQTWLGLIVVYTGIFLFNFIVVQRILGILVAPAGRSIPNVTTWGVFYNVFSFLQLANGPFLSLFRLLFLACSGLIGVAIFDRNIFPVLEFLDGGYSAFMAMVATRQALEAKEQHPWRRLRRLVQSPAFEQYKQRVQNEKAEEERRTAGRSTGTAPWQAVFARARQARSSPSETAQSGDFTNAQAGEDRNPSELGNDFLGASAGQQGRLRQRLANFFSGIRQRPDGLECTRASHDDPTSAGMNRA